MEEIVLRKHFVSVKFHRGLQKHVLAIPKDHGGVGHEEFYQLIPFVSSATEAATENFLRLAVSHVGTVSVAASSIWEYDLRSENRELNFNNTVLVPTQGVTLAQEGGSKAYYLGKYNQEEQMFSFCPISDSTHDEIMKGFDPLIEAGRLATFGQYAEQFLGPVLEQKKETRSTWFKKLTNKITGK